MLISQRLSDIVDSNVLNTIPPPDFQVTTTQESYGKRQTVENFTSSFGDTNDFPQTVVNNIVEEEPKEPIEENNKSESNELLKKIEQSQSQSRHRTLQYNDNFSGMKIVGKAKKSEKSEPAPAVKTSVVSSDKETQTNLNTESDKLNEDSKIIYRPEKIIETPSVLIKEPIVEKEIKSEIKPVFTEDISKPKDNVNIIEEQIHLDVDSENITSVLEYQDKILETPEPIIENKKIKVDLPTSVFFEKDMLLGNEPKLEFEYFVSRILMIIRSATDTSTAVFIMNDNSGENMIIESYATDKPNIMKKKGKYPIGNDIVSQIMRSSKPEILTEINPSAEMDLIPYYSEPSNSLSFIGVPVLWNESLIGVLAADSKSSNTYDFSTVAFIGHFSKLLSAIVKSYTHKYDLLQAAKTLESIAMFSNMASNGKSNSDKLGDALVDSLSNIFEGYNAGLVGFNSNKNYWEIKSFKSKYINDKNKEINLNMSLVGESIINGQLIHKKQVELQNIIRVHKSEQNHQTGEFACVPIKTANGLYGAAYIENFEDENLTKYDLSVFEILADNAANAIERMHLIELYESSCILDRNTGLLNPTAFYERIEEESRRSVDYNYPLTLCLFRVDKYATIDQEKFASRFEVAHYNVFEITRKFIKKYEAFGRVDEETFGILFVSKDTNQVKLIAERLRNEIANKVLDNDGFKFSVTLSIGIATFNPKHNINSFITNTISALLKSTEFSNHVHIYY